MIKSWQGLYETDMGKVVEKRLGLSKVAFIYANYHML